MRNAKLLLVEDNNKEAGKIKKWLLEAGVTAQNFHHARTHRGALRLLKRGHFDAILLELFLPDSSGATSLTKLRPHLEDTPVIVISGQENSALVIQLLHNGAQDYLIKGKYNALALVHAIRLAVERQALAAEFKRQAQEMTLLKESVENIVLHNLDAIVVVDEQNMIRYANAAAAKSLGVKREEMIGSAFEHSFSVGLVTEADFPNDDGTVRHIEIRAVSMMWQKRPANLIILCDKNCQDRRSESYSDALTGLYNKTYFDREAQRIDRPENLPLSVIIGDVNNLKLVNDSLGHKAGDELLKTVANIFQHVCVNEGIAIRYGGDEFMLIQRDCNERDCMKIMEKVVDFCKESSMNGFPISIALGSAVKYRGDSLTVKDMLRIADEHMYAKKYTVSSPSKYSAVFASLEKSLYAKDYSTAMHTSRVREKCVAFGKYLHMDNSVIDELILMSALHDIGKIALPSSILRKPGALNEEEWVIIKTHPEIGAKIARVTHGMDAVAQNILNHHERWDGEGYPNGLKGEKITLSARILSIVDSFDVMTHDRPYRRACAEQDALAEIECCSGTQFDPKLAEAFVAFAQNREAQFN